MDRCIYIAFSTEWFQQHKTSLRETDPYTVNRHYSVRFRPLMRCSTCSHLLNQEKSKVLGLAQGHYDTSTSGISPQTFKSVDKSSSEPWPQGFCALYTRATCRLVSLGVNSKPSSWQAVTKKPLIFRDYLSFLQYLIKLRSQALVMDEDVDVAQNKHTPLRVVSLTESSVLAETITGIIFCPCMEYMYWWKVEIESSENRRSSWGLIWAFYFQ